MCSVRGDVLCEGCLWCVRTLCGLRSGEVPDEGNRKLLKHLRRFGESERNPFHCGLVFPSNLSARSGVISLFTCHFLFRFAFPSMCCGCSCG